MMRRYILVFVALASLAPWSPAEAEERLDGAAIRARIVGNTITIVNQDLQLATGLVEADGAMRGHIGGVKFDGKWFIKNDSELCFDLPEQTFDVCRVVVAAGPNINFFATTGEPRGRAEILKGNPYGF